MTGREVYEAVLIELNKMGTPDLLLDEFNYYINKGLYQYVSKRYNVYDSSQQTTDDLQVLKASSILTGDALKHIGQKQTTSIGDITEAKYKVALPENYFHLLNCVLTYKLSKDYKCWTKDYKIDMPAKRLTADGYSAILNNAWLKPQYKAPYFIVNSNDLQIEGDWANNPTYDNESVKDKIKRKAGKATAHNAWEDTNEDGFLSANDKLIGPNMIIDYGKDNTIFELHSVNVNYLKVPKRVRITPEQIEMTEDHSQIMEFPEYVCREIIKEILALIMLRNGDPSLQAHMAVNQSIPSNPNGGQPNQQQSR